jgi:hypothetical protein
MRVSLLASVALAMLAETAFARNCDGGLDYCGYNLNKIGIVPCELVVTKRMLTNLQATTRARWKPHAELQEPRARAK